MTGIGSSCGACKFLRRKCTSGCVFAPYFCYDEAANHFAAVHRVFGASNVSKLLLNLPVERRYEAAISISYEALARMHDPVYGCFSHIFALQQQVACLQEEIDILGNQMAKEALCLPTNGGTQETKNPNIGLQFYSGTNEMKTDNYLNQRIPVLSDVGCTSANQEFYSQMMNVELPTLHPWEEHTSHVSSNSDLPETLFEGMNEEIFLPSLWLANSCHSLT